MNINGASWWQWIELGLLFGFGFAAGQFCFNSLVMTIKSTLSK